MWLLLWDNLYYTQELTEVCALNLPQQKDLQKINVGTAENVAGDRETA